MDLLLPTVLIRFQVYVPSPRCNNLHLADFIRPLWFLYIVYQPRIETTNNA